jgi:cytochrome c oxidase subunit II
VRARLLLSVCSSLLGSLVLVGPALARNGTNFAPVTPDSANANGIRDSYLFVSLFVLGIFLLVEGLLIAFVIRYRRRNRQRFEDGAPIHGSSRLELAWTAFPVVILFLIGGFVFWKLPGIDTVPAAKATGQLDIRVTGQQFYWQFEYPNGAISIDTMRAPVGVPVKLYVTSPDTDVIHSWWIPSLGGKIDAIPGRVNTTWFQAKTVGTYKGQCAELCGLQHAHMTAQVQVLPRTEFDTWVTQRQADQAAGAASVGKEMWQGVCAKCHGLAGTGGIGPNISASQTLQDPAALEKLVRNGLTGNRGVMPPVGEHWTSEQIASLASYLQNGVPSGS